MAFVQKGKQFRSEKDHEEEAPRVRGIPKIKWEDHIIWYKKSGNKECENKAKDISGCRKTADDLKIHKNFQRYEEVKMD